MTEVNQIADDVSSWRWPKASREWLAFSVVAVYLFASAPTVQAAWYSMALLFVGLSFGKIIYSKKSARN